MIALRFTIRTIALCALFGSASFAAEEPVGVPVRIWGAGTAVSQRYGDPAVLEFATTFLESAPGAGDGAYSSWGQYTGAGAGGITVPQKTVRAEPGKRYLIDVIGDYVSYFSISTSAPAGYRVEIEGVVRKRMEVPGIGPFYYGTVAFRVLEHRASFTERAGVATQIDENKPHWSVALGFLRNGGSAGALSIIDAGTSSSWSTLFTPAALQYEAPSSEIQVHRSSGVIRQVLANQAAVDVVTVNSTTYELRFYNPGQVVGSSFPRTFNGDPYVVYEVTQGSTSTTLKITSKTRNVTSTTGSFSVVRTAVTTLARTGSWPTFDWTRSDWNTSGQAQVVEQYSDGSGTASARVEDLEIRPGGSTTEAISVERTYKLYGWGEQLEKERLGTGAYVETTRDYYTNSSEPGRYGFLKSVKETGDNWTAYDYWDSGTAGAKTGQVKYKFRPWLGSPSTVSFTTTTGEVTYFEYVADPWGANTRPSLVETKVNSVLTAKSTTSYSDVGTANGMTLVQAVRNDYSDSTNYLTTTTRYYKENTADAFYRSQVHSVVQPGNLKTSFLRQRGTWSGGTFTKSANGGTSDGTASRIAIISGTTATGTLRQTEDSYDIDDLYLVTGQSTMAVTIRDSSALIVRTESHVWTGSAWALIGSNNNTYTYAGQLLQSTANNGAVRDWAWNGEQLASQTDEAGVVVNYSLYDHAGRVKEVSNVDGRPTEFTYNAAGKVTQETLKWTGTPTTNETITVTREFDDAGRLIKETPPGLGDTEFSYDPANRTRTTELADGGTRVEAYFLDGRLEKITGDGVVEQFYSYAIESDGRRRTQVNVASSTSGRWSKTWTDWLGRTIQEDVPTWNSGSPSSRVHTYDSAGRLWKITQPGLAATLRTYDSMGNLATQGLDINGTANSLDAGSDDRIRVYSTTIYDSGSGTWWLKQTESTYPISMNGTTLKELGRTETKLTNLATNRLSHVESFDIYGNKTESYTTVDRGNKILTSYIDVPGSTINAYQKIENGLLIESEDTAGVRTTFGYDLLGRHITSTDERIGPTTTAYVEGTARVHSVSDPASVVQAIYDYDTLGRIKSASVPNPNYSPSGDTRTRLLSHTSYTLKGQVKQQWGETTYPVEFAYDSYGQQTGMTTYATSTATFTGATWPATTPDNPQTTTWAFDEETGLLESKTDANDKTVDYTYTCAGQVYERKWVRVVPNTSTRVKTTYAYSATTGELTSIDYNDSTPDVTYTYNRIGALATVADYTSLNNPPRSFTYNLSDTLELQREDLPPFYWSRKITYDYEASITGALGRPTGFKLGTTSDPDEVHSVGYGYSTTDGRLNQVTANGQAFNYGYLGNSHLIETTSTTFNSVNYLDTRSWHEDHDWLTGRESKWGSSIKTNFGYQHDLVGRISSVRKTGAVFARYGDNSEGLTTSFAYNDRSELASEVTTVGESSTKLTGRDDSAYEYDLMGNRKEVTHNDTSFTFSANILNQYTSRSFPRVFDVAGATPEGTVTISSPQPPAKDPQPTVARHGEYFFQGREFNGTGAVFTTINIDDGMDEANIPAYLNPSTQTLNYDDDGNLKGDGRWAYTYDAENRLIWMETHSTALAAGAPKVAFHIFYDYLGRRVLKHPYQWLNSTWTSVGVSERYIYNGWNVIARIDNGNLNAIKSFFWGMDIAGPGQRAGGIGALLMIKDGDNKFVPAYDGMGNLHALMTTASVTLGGTAYAAGDIVAAYEYDAFGQTIRESGPYAASNPFRFSTKYTDLDTGLVYFGLRYYSPALGRFINRDPISESGGLNLYGYVGNSATNSWDYLGLDGDGDEPTGGDGASRRPERPAPQEDESIETFWSEYGTFVVIFNDTNTTFEFFFNGELDAEKQNNANGISADERARRSRERVSEGGIGGGRRPGRVDSSNKGPVTLAPYTVTHNTRNGNTVGSVNGRIVSYELDSGDGAILNQQTGEWMRYGPGRGGIFSSFGPALTRFVATFGGPRLNRIWNAAAEWGDEAGRSVAGFTYNLTFRWSGTAGVDPADPTFQAGQSIGTATAVNLGVVAGGAGAMYWGSYLFTPEIGLGFGYYSGTQGMKYLALNGIGMLESSPAGKWIFNHQTAFRWKIGSAGYAITGALSGRPVFYSGTGAGYYWVTWEQPFLAKLGASVVTVP